mmetsp:Transcript_606/g.1150  ORF Transcript_606/g.1150 Transcript_606/m.1150 type:complete len:215 (+) Transcript_606:1342-1986(+)
MLVFEQVEHPTGVVVEEHFKRSVAALIATIIDLSHTRNEPHILRILLLVAGAAHLLVRRLCVDRDPINVILPDLLGESLLCSLKGRVVGSELQCGWMNGEIEIDAAACRVWLHHIRNERNALIRDAQFTANHGHGRNDLGWFLTNEFLLLITIIDNTKILHFLLHFFFHFIAKFRKRNHFARSVFSRCRRRRRSGRLWSLIHDSTLFLGMNVTT